MLTFWREKKKFKYSAMNNKLTKEYKYDDLIINNY